MSRKTKVAILGAGFSGMTLARSLQKRGLQVEVFEASSKVGGLIQTRTEPILVESAAHAFLSSRDVEKLFAELGMDPVKPGYRSKNKWIYRGGAARKWPLKLGESLFLFLKFLRGRKNLQQQPDPQETVAAWVEKNASAALRDYLIAPAFQGIYGAQPDQLSASLILGSFLTKELRAPRGQISGSIAPKNGMQEIMQALQADLAKRQIPIHFSSAPEISDLEKDFDAVVVATSMDSASSVLKQAAPKLARELSDLPKVSLVSATVALDKAGSRVQGFGCLFPKKEKTKALGVLFNTDLFENRGDLTNETWIFGEEALAKNETQILEDIRMDRKRLSGREIEIRFSEIFRWDKVLPLYGLELESVLNGDLFVKAAQTLPNSSLEVFWQGARLSESAMPLYLTGNYLGGIGLTKILTYNDRLSERIQKESETR